MHFPLLPLEFMAVHLETNALGLDNVKGLQIIPECEILIILGDEVGEEVKPPGWRWDTFSIRVTQRSDVQRVGRRRGRRQFVFFFPLADI